MDILNILLLAPPFLFTSDVPATPETPAAVVAEETTAVVSGAGFFYDYEESEAIKRNMPIENRDLIEFAIMLTRVL